MLNNFIMFNINITIRHIIILEVDVSRPNQSILKFVTRQLTRLPLFYRIPVIILTVIFSYHTILLHGKPFYFLDISAQKKIIQQINFGKSGFLRELIRFYRSLILLKSYE